MVNPRHRRNRHLHQRIDIVGIIWNHCVALQRRYFKLTGKYISKYDLMRHITKLKKLPKYESWNLVDAQAIQNIVERLDRSYQQFFKSKKGESSRKYGRPTFKKVKKYKSFTLKQTGWKLLGGNKIRIQGRVYKFSKSREIDGMMARSAHFVIKTVTIKRDPRGNLWLCFSVEIEVDPPTVDVMTGQTAGFDLG